MSDDDVFAIGKLRRPGFPSAAVSYDPSHGIRLEGEKIPSTPADAAAWLRRHSGWLRVYGRARKHGAPTAVRDFLVAWRRLG